MRNQKLEDHLSDFMSVLVEFTKKSTVKSKESKFGPNENVNVILGGKFALQLHGIQMSREPEDLDIIIYDPSSFQIKLFDTLREKNDIIKDRPAAVLEKEVDYEGNVGRDKVRVIKLESNEGRFMDVILNDRPHPDGLNSLLTYNALGLRWPIQSVHRVIEAKASYGFTFGYLPAKEGVNQIKYMRSKDMLDFLDFKNSNFNVPGDNKFEF